tara:strand:- start:1965 stop:2585 length:621 start_codon:yes stop_codon:yes gene_type:complete
LKGNKMTKFYKKIDIQHYNNEIILNHPDVQKLLVKKDYEKSWNLPLFDLKSALPEFYEWCENFFNSKINVTRFFITFPNSKTGIHEDWGYTLALNIPIINCNKHSKNVWYDVDRSLTSDLIWKKDSDGLTYAAHNAAAIVFPEESIIGTLDEMALDSPTLFNTSIPHNVVAENFEIADGPRILLSVRTESMKRSSLKEFKEFIKDY